MNTQATKKHTKNTPSVKGQGKTLHLTTAQEAYVNQAQKIITATYMVTDLVTDNNVLVSAARTSATEGLVSLHRKDQNTRNHYNQLLSYLSVLFSTNQISKMNHDVLYSEIQKQIQGISDLVSERKETAGVGEVDLAGEVFANNAQGNFLPQTSDYKEEILEEDSSVGSSVSEEIQKDTVSDQDTPIFVGTSKPLESQSNTEKRSMPEGVKPAISESYATALLKNLTAGDMAKSSAKKTTKNTQARNERREKILSILGNTEDASINDICDQFEGCSSKTIQRDLIDLIDQGHVTKNGSRRWSTYNLVK